jgi:hypothetical protein
MLLKKGKAYQRYRIEPYASARRILGLGSEAEATAAFGEEDAAK